MQFAKIILVINTFIIGLWSQCEEDVKNFDGYTCVDPYPLDISMTAITYLVVKDGVSYMLKNSFDAIEPPSGKSETEILQLIGESPYITKQINEFKSDLLNLQILEYGNGGLLSDLAQNRKGNAFQTSFILSTLDQILKATTYVHDKKWVWGSLKQDNVIFKTDDTLMITNFINAMPVGSTRKSLNNDIYFGIQFFMDPTFFTDRDIKFDTTTDIYSFGVLAYAITMFKMPFFDFFNISREVREDGTFLLPQGMSKSLAMIIDGCMKFNPVDRLKADEIQALITKGLNEDKYVVLEHAYVVSLFSKIDFDQPAGFFARNNGAIRKSLYCGFAVVMIAFVILGIFMPQDRKKDHEIPIVNQVIQG